MRIQDYLKGHLSFSFLPQVGSHPYPAILARTLRLTARVTEVLAADPSTSLQAATSPVNPRPQWSVITTLAHRRLVLTLEVMLLVQMFFPLKKMQLHLQSRNPNGLKNNSKYSSVFREMQKVSLLI